MATSTSDSIGSQERPWGAVTPAKGECRALGQTGGVDSLGHTGMEDKQDTGKVGGYVH